MSKIEKIDFEKGLLIGKDGKTYRIESSMSAERYAHWQALEKELAYGLTIGKLFEKHKELHNLINGMKFADAAVMNMDIMRGISKLEERQPTIMKMCALMINEENEDRGIINQDMIDKKVANLSHYDYADFFAVATQSVSGLIDVYRTFTEAVAQIPVMDTE